MSCLNNIVQAAEGLKNRRFSEDFRGRAAVPFLATFPALVVRMTPGRRVRLIFCGGGGLGIRRKG